MLEQLLLGTYTRRESKGIYQTVLDTEKKALASTSLIINESSPTYLTLDKKVELYTVTLVGEEGGVAAYKSIDDQYDLLNKVTEIGAPPCYVSVDEKRQLIYSASYHEGIVYVFQILPNGQLKSTDRVVHKETTGPHKNQDKPHVHYTNLTPDNRLVVCDLGTDRVYTYDVDRTGKLIEVAQYLAEPGCGPRHIVFHPNQQIAYLIGELDSSISVLSYDKTNGEFQRLTKVSTIPENFDGFNSGAAIRISSDGQYVYASNRGHNTIAIFETSQEGKRLKRKQLISTEGDFPRDFNLDPSEKFIVAANQNSDNLTLYERDTQTGLLKMIQKDVYVPECVCVYFK